MAGLREGEAFNIIACSNAMDLFAPTPVLKDQQTLAAAQQYLEGITAVGGTNIYQEALKAALYQPARQGMLPIVLFSTDGLPTVDQTSELAIRDLAAKANPHGRGSEGSGTSSPQICPTCWNGINWGSWASMQAQVLSGSSWRAVAKRPGPYLLCHPGKADQADAFIPRPSASRKIAYLIDLVRQMEADRSDPCRDPKVRELTDEIVRLSTRFGILTEYTAFLAREGTDIRDYEELSRQNRQASLALPGEVLLSVNGRTVLVRMPQATASRGR